MRTVTPNRRDVHRNYQRTVDSPALRSKFVGGCWHAGSAMTNVRTLRFHAEHGPAALFERAYHQLGELTGLGLEIPHARIRFDEREIPIAYLSDFRPQHWEVITVDTAVRTGRITYMSLRRKLESDRYLWIVLAYEHVITAWITESSASRATSPLIVKDGPAWDVAAQGRDPKWTPAMAEWEQTYARRVRAHQILTTLDSSPPERPSGDRLAQAARIALGGGTWNDAAVGAGWSSRKPMDAAIARLFRAAKRGDSAGNGYRHPP